MKSAVGSRGLLRWVSQVALVFVFTTMLLMTLVSNPQEESEVNLRREIHRQKTIMKEKIRESKLRELQKTLFINAKRPADQTYNINITLSENTPLDREIPDTRPEACRDIKYDTATLPTISVVSIFYNEGLSMILRTVHSVLKRTPPELLVDIVLVNDHSTNEDLGEPLERYIKLLPDKVKLIRTKKREGLIRARMIGANLAKGEVIMFQDAHTEANVGWAEPMLEEIRKNPATIIQPEVEQIEAWTLQYIGSTSVVPRGGWSWDLRYVWMEIPQHEKDRITKEALERGIAPQVIPFRAAALVGCALAVRKDHFIKIGAFDEGMNVWGGENIELAMRNWMCGGRVITHPCSRVAHTFKPFAYKFDGDREKIVEKNLIRIAELWMDDWKKFFLASTYNWPSKHTYFEPHEIRSLEERKNLKKKLGCKGFDWYMKTITPEVSTPPMDATYYGEVTNLKTEACWYAAKDGYVTLTYFCFFHRFLPNNVFYINTKNEMIYFGKCVRIDQYFLLKLEDCSQPGSGERWYVEPIAEVEGIIKVDYMRGGKTITQCMTQVTNINPPHYKDQMPQAIACQADNEYQRWRFHYKFRFDYDFNPPTVIQGRL